MTPAADDQLAAVLDEIAEMEAGPGFEGPMISIEIAAIQAIKDDFDEQQFMDDDGNVALFPADWLEDIVVGAIARAAKAHRNPENHLEDWMIDIEDGGDDQFVVHIKDRLGHKLGVGQGPLALAAALAYRDALMISSLEEGEDEAAKSQ